MDPFIIGEQLDEKTKFLLTKLQSKEDQLQSKDIEIQKLKSELDILKNQILNKNRKIFGQSSE